tara:strand:+ start:61 stop:171 length:111 start_codon:yes stop_codon:yes gene_type:complete
MIDSIKTFLKKKSALGDKYFMFYIILEFFGKFDENF